MRADYSNEAEELDRVCPRGHLEHMTLRIAQLEIDGQGVLAPMAGYTDRGFRLLCAEQGAALVFTEMISAEGLLRNVPTTLRMMRIDDGERPVGLQLYGPDPQRVAEAAVVAEELVSPDLIDLNMGCPARKVVRKGSGVALMRDPPRAEEMVRAVTAAVSCPVTVKMRSGWSADEVNAVELAKRFEGSGCAALCVHARTRSQVHSGKVDLDLLAEVRSAVGVPVIGNGGVNSAEQATRMMDATGVEAVMVGRAAIGNPWIFREIAQGSGYEVPPEQIVSAVARHLDTLIEANVLAKRDRPEERACSRIRGHLVRYTSGRPGSGTFRRSLSQLGDRETLMWALDDLLSFS